MNVLLYTGLLLLLLGLQISFWPSVTGVVMPAFILAAAFAVGLQDRLLTGFRIAFIGGLLLDLYAQLHFGRFTLAALAGYGLAVVLLRGQTADLISTPYRLSLVTAGALLYELVVLIFIRVGNGSFPFFSQLTQVATLNVLATVVTYGVFTGIVVVLTRNQRTYGPRSLSE